MLFRSRHVQLHLTDKNAARHYISNSMRDISMSFRLGSFGKMAVSCCLSTHSMHCLYKQESRSFRIFPRGAHHGLYTFYVQCMQMFPLFRTFYTLAIKSRRPCSIAIGMTRWPSKQPMSCLIIWSSNINQCSHLHYSLCLLGAMVVGNKSKLQSGSMYNASYTSVPHSTLYPF